MSDEPPARARGASDASSTQRPSATPTSRRAGCGAHKSGSVRGVPVRAGAPTRRPLPSRERQYDQKARERPLNASERSLRERATPGLRVRAPVVLCQDIVDTFMPGHG
jgi:hypothetical protein